MAEYFRSHFTIVGAGEEGLPLLNQARDVAKTWVEDAFFKYDGESDEPIADGDDLDGTGFFSLTWRVRDGWQLDLRLATDGCDVEMEVEVRDPGDVDLADDSRRAKSLAYSPNLLERMFDEFDCRFNGESLKSRAVRLTEDDAASFAKDVLLNPERRLPVVAVSENSFGRCLADPDALQSRLLGIASVVVYGNAVSQIIRRELPKLGCYNGAARVYAPELSPDDHPAMHRYWLGNNARNLNESWWEVRDACMFHSPPDARRRLYDQVSSQIHQKRLQNLQDRLRHAHLDSQSARDLLGDKQAAEDLADEVQRSLEGYRAENERLSAANFQLRDDNRRLEWEKEQLRAQLANARDGSQTEPEMPPTLNSVKAAVDLADSRFAGVRFLASAFKSASDSNFARPDEVLSIFEAMDACAAKRAAGPLGKEVKDWFAESGITYAPNESETTKGMYRKERTFDGIFMPAHFKLGRHMRIHVDWNEESNLWRVGHVGEHLPISSNR